MASTNKCEYCGSTITSEDQTCPNCGASNPLYVVDLPRRVTDPKTIEELQEYCAERGMPLLRMRFFIGQDCKEPKAFGIYKESADNFVVYKNKADGTRAVRYSGPDEAKAVGEIYDKLMQECYDRGIYPDGKPAQRNTQTAYRSGNSGFGSVFTGGSGKLTLGKLILIIMIIVFLLKIFGGLGTGSIIGNLFSGGSSYSSDYYGGNDYSSDYDSGNNGSWWNNDNGSDNSSSWWWSSDDDDDDDSSSWWSSDDDDNSSSWDSDWDSGWSDWDSGGTDWDSDW
ncbi:MAG: zinc ribbon domain-containing protein [Lachnospiraceae bacterium]|nr:zinc ribbon domain-containing protein [Lachnospiraceae bacterium]